MKITTVPTSFNIDLEFEIPEFHRRLFSWLIDVCVQVFYVLIADKIYKAIIADNFSSISDADLYNRQELGTIFFLPVLVYHLVLEITLNGQSIGKKMMGIRVVNENGGKASISQFLIRWLIRVSDFVILIIIIYGPLLGPLLAWFLIGSFILLITDVVLVVSTKKSQRLGDILAHTILIRTSTSGSVYDTVFMEVSDSYIPAFPQIMQLSDKDINAVKSILDAASKKGDFQLAAMASDKIKNHLKIESHLSPFDFLKTVMKDYNYLSTK